ncbi:1-deoxy-D-xylulose-5-phosphate reductoisomerase [Corynebacterium glutamicum]|uniref:1-deoxy-D-xylulose 5-phosphate reductoisomerase n=1 Tax=Corynebacterium glutamicum (strain ATCC 13032 / DSM 20300 / JCM 1318 / BCRC 11384 / CCUG 27702 / LMG 3730 / NBRC 12168 / NCIMB 10025 / NRRL B-2784 / 534) TaxID=196627 RepID=DXR_CORGL|nr:1-deoxy-D-xylulose-5-phosphate reductoisomerase [Corynebacterium glutamicum]Q8NP10.1 RecName: Full=1-deoxy-D-xylulose 5-phosphate reductoisomerase; Short=DXP reductoisomerase; AltName: Full=1-deoxyxylulose-5-phosphate reductoisomerase; AltName: Full=2-C-methyl-D-erythritol 4-phosphate synthase [Corynebacterium glutamicum ATCC 13032]ARV63927.1 1-deoxy-D-xylulose-5-phosphate reductoisomerase [Corynebacterium glutamicum]AUI01483.1 1-deoxy-D-xylulose-5-phosphate reductoisomerase [Corynebacterium 
MGVVTKKILILGSTGSIGTQALDVIADNSDKFEVVGIAAGGSQPDLVISQAQQLGLAADKVAVADAQAAAVISKALGGEIISGTDAAKILVETTKADTVLNALVGSLGLAATLATLESGAHLALANKESLVAGGEFVTSKAKLGQIIPVDSEHSAMAQCLRSGTRDEVARIVLTASGGPFRGWTREKMWEVTPEQAAAHPTWAMGQMNTLNSATLINKGLELIEATLLFETDADLIDVTVHPQSIIHSMITFTDGATIAQASPPSMKLPIALALDWPHRVPKAQPALDFTAAHTWAFEPVDDAAFPAVQLARHVAKQKGTYPAVYNAANEEAAEAFLRGRIKFPQIVDVVDEVLQGASQFAGVASHVDDILATESEARARANALINRLATNL